MRAFPTKILLAMDGYQSTERATRTAIRMADDDERELHLVYVEPLPGYPVYAPIGARHLEGELHERAEREGLERLWKLDEG
jgi:nucleotide-binding universal stress UspA family protein